MNKPWLEKYRPHTLEDVVGNEHAVHTLSMFAEQGNIPNIILSGPPGTGKTTSIAALARRLLGDQYDNAVLELNASDERGIDVVRNKIKMFSQRKVHLPPGRHKIIILDEGDSMTIGAQQALRRIMEIYSSTTRFAIACNISSKIIEAIQSRCAILRFSRLSDDEVLGRLKLVLEAEKVSSFTLKGLEAIVFTAEGDLRSAMNNLQATYAGFEVITAENVYKVCDQPDPIAASQLLDLCMLGKTRSALSRLKSLWDLGHMPSDLINTLFRVCKSHEMPQVLRLAYVKAIACTHMRVSEGVSTYVQVTGLIAKLCMLSSNTPKN